MREFQYNQCMSPLRDSMGKIAWVRDDFLSQGKISDILIRCARKDFLSPVKISDILIQCARKEFLSQGKISDILIRCARKNFLIWVKTTQSRSDVQVFGSKIIHERTQSVECATFLGQTSWFRQIMPRQ